jgi:hypothetical protein
MKTDRFVDNSLTVIRFLVSDILLRCFGQQLYRFSQNFVRPVHAHPIDSDSLLLTWLGDYNGPHIHDTVARNTSIGWNLPEQGK